MTAEPTGTDGAWQALRKTSTAELCAEGRLDGERDLRLEKWWVRAEGDELLRLSQYDEGRRRQGPVYVSEAELIGLLDAAWTAGVLSDFFKRQLFQLVATRFEE